VCVENQESWIACDLRLIASMVKYNYDKTLFPENVST
jgi:hypothetical protein